MIDQANMKRIERRIKRLVAEGKIGAASCDTLPKGQDAKQGLAGTEGSAVGATSAETPKV